VKVLAEADRVFEVGLEDYDSTVDVACLQARVRTGVALCIWMRFAGRNRSFDMRLYCRERVEETMPQLRSERS
jgi:hypothetical protein